MSFQWLTQRIQEEEDRRRREKLTLERLPTALEELHGILNECIRSFQGTFSSELVESDLLPSRIQITARDQDIRGAEQTRKVEVIIDQAIPGFRIQRGEVSLAVEIGLLGSDKLFYRDLERDMYLNMEDLTRRILDPVLFPKLRE